MTSFTQILNQGLEQGKLMAPQIVGNRAPKNVSSNVRKTLKFGKIFRADLLCTKMKKK